MNTLVICDQFPSEVQNLRQHNQQQSEAFLFDYFDLGPIHKASLPIS